MAGIKKIATERANLFNKKLRDCRVHLNTNKAGAEDSVIFITEGDSHEWFLN